MRVSIGAAAKVFFAAEGILYLLFLYQDLRQESEAAIWLKYAGILLCFFMALVSAGRGGDWLVAAALGLTVAADTFLLVLDAHYAAGVLIFLGVQAVYLLRLKRADGGRWMPALRVAVLGALLAALWLLGQFQPLNVLAVVYFSTLVCNTVQSVQSAAPWGKRFGLGLLLFACCDLCVGGYNSPGMLPAGLYVFVRVGMWLFYLPSQMIIVSSGFPGQKEIVHETE